MADKLLNNEPLTWTKLPNNLFYLFYELLPLSHSSAFISGANNKIKKKYGVHWLAAVWSRLWSPILMKALLPARSSKQQTNPSQQHHGTTAGCSLKPADKKKAANLKSILENKSVQVLFSVERFGAGYYCKYNNICSNMLERLLPHSLSVTTRPNTSERNSSEEQTS